MASQHGAAVGNLAIKASDCVRFQGALPPADA